jgi:hypothetical protein
MRERFFKKDGDIRAELLMTPCRIVLFPHVEVSNSEKAIFIYKNSLFL